MEKRMIKGNKNVEQLSHFHCGECRKWWSIGDAPKGKHRWFCPWCGKEQTFTTPKHKRS